MASNFNKKNQNSPIKRVISSAKNTLANLNDNLGKSDDPALRKFFVDSLRDMYWAEKHLVKTLPKMAKAATSKKLEHAFLEHLSQTEVHVSRLEKCFDALSETARAKKCDAMAGLIEEGKSIIDETEEDTATRDVGLILAAQKVEHYEIASYGGLAQLARTLGLTKVSDLLAKTLEEEKQTDALLTEIAENNINYVAASEAA